MAVEKFVTRLYIRIGNVHDLNLDFRIGQLQMKIRQSKEHIVVSISCQYT